MGMGGGKNNIATFCHVIETSTPTCMAEKGVERLARIVMAMWAFIMWNVENLASILLNHNIIYF